MRPVSPFSPAGFLALAAVVLPSLAAVPASAQTTLSFDNFTAQAKANGGAYLLPGTTYSTQGFTLDSNRNGFVAFDGASVLGDGETSLYSNQNSPATLDQKGSTTLTQDNGKAFSLNAIDLGPYLGGYAIEGDNNSGPVLFTGTRAGGTTITDIKTITSGHFQTFYFTGFTDIQSLTLTPQSSTRPRSGVMQFSAPLFDNVVLNSPTSAAPEPSPLIGLGFAAFGVLALMLRARKRLAAAIS